MVSGSLLFQNDLSRCWLMCNLTSCVVCTKSFIRFQKIIRDSLCQCFLGELPNKTYGLKTDWQLLTFILSVFPNSCNEGHRVRCFADEVKV